MHTVTTFLGAWRRPVLLGFLTWPVGVCAGQATTSPTPAPPASVQATAEAQGQAQGQAAAEAEDTTGARPMEYLRADAARLLQHVQSVGVKRYLLATNWAPIIEEARAVYYDKSTRDAKTPAEFEALPEEKKASYARRELGEKFYYHTRYGSPHAYARALDLACRSMREDGECFRQGMKILDFGCGGVVHLRLLASLGMQVTGVDVDPLLKAFYREAGDQGEIPGVYIQTGERGPSGLLQLVFGSWPGDEATRASVGDRYDLVISKNTLKNGYINPEREIPESQRIRLGVENEKFVEEIARVLNPGGRFIIYNICPRQKKPEEGYIPWADGRCPFPREMLETHGLKVLEFDKDDSEMMRQHALALEWHKGESAMDLNNDLVVTYTLCERAAKGETAKDDTVKGR